MLTPEQYLMAWPWLKFKRQVLDALNRTIHMFPELLVAVVYLSTEGNFVKISLLRLSKAHCSPIQVSCPVALPINEGTALERLRIAEHDWNLGKKFIDQMIGFHQSLTSDIDRSQLHVIQEVASSYDNYNWVLQTESTGLLFCHATKTTTTYA